MRESALLDDVIPPFGATEDLPDAYVRFLEPVPAADLAAGASLTPSP